VVDPVAVAWSVFRSWDLAAPVWSVTPADRGITGTPTFVKAESPGAITYDETLPDGTALSVRAHVTGLTVLWGDGGRDVFDPGEALGYPAGAVSHIYRLKTCTAAYRIEHPSGGLCHPTEEHYSIEAAYTWEGEYSIGSGWVSLGTLEVGASPVAYDIDEARGVPTS